MRAVGAQRHCRLPRLAFFTSGARGKTAILGPQPGHHAGPASARLLRAHWWAEAQRGLATVLPMQIHVYIYMYAYI